MEEQWEKSIWTIQPWSDSRQSCPASSSPSCRAGCRFSSSSRLQKGRDKIGAVLRAGAAAPGFSWCLCSTWSETQPRCLPQLPKRLLSSFRGIIGSLLTHEVDALSAFQLNTGFPLWYKAAGNFVSADSSTDGCLKTESNQSRRLSSSLQGLCWGQLPEQCRMFQLWHRVQKDRCVYLEILEADRGLCDLKVWEFPSWKIFNRVCNHV